MFERRVQTAYHLRSGFEERLCFRFIDFINVAAQMIDQNPKFFPNIRGMRPRIFSCNRFHIMGSLVVRPADGSERGDARAPGEHRLPVRHRTDSPW